VVIQSNSEKYKVLTIFFQILRRKRTLIGSGLLMVHHNKDSQGVGSHLTYSLKCSVEAGGTRSDFHRDLVVL
jgi:hypothetical protein